jgi:tetratricopeptide (TPR) repeat protein
MDVTIYKELKQPSQYHRSFLDGFQYFTKEKFADALPLFFIAFNESDDNNRNKYLSYYGRTLFHIDDKQEGLKSCLKAAKEERMHSDVFYNLAYVASNTNKRELAIKAIAQGRAIDPYDTQLIHLRRALGLRRKPVLGFLSRQNIANVVLGKLSYLVFKQA